jgi:GNAT superfamily N-acetyltransferase
VEASGLRIETVAARAARGRFVRVARTIYPADSPWVRPLDDIVLDYLNPRRNPFFEQGTAAAYLCVRDGRDVGRILVHVWRRHRRLHGEAAGYFGFFECVDDAEAARTLLSAAARFARAQGCDRLRGPFNMTAAQEIGIVTEGFENPPAVDMVYTPAWYPRLIEGAGFRPCLHMTTWRNPDIAALDPDALVREPHRRLLAEGMRVRAIHSRRRDADMEQVRELINGAFLGNWGFVPITRAEWALQVGTLLPLLDPALVLLAEVQGVPIGVTFAVPDFNEVIRHLDGRLLHPAALRLLKRPPARAAVVILFAVRKPYQGLGVNRMLNAELVRALQRRGYRSLAITWIAGENAASRAQASALGMQPLHELAVYERALP